MKKKILIEGYYNAGNLGDDLLMISSYHLINLVFNDSDIWINKRNNNEKLYITHLLPQAKVFNSGKDKIDFDLIVKGGGGLFFGFRNRSIKWGILNFIFRYLGIDILGLRSQFQISKSPLIGIGIGFGPYSWASSNYIRHMMIAKEFSFLSVRDQFSYKLIKPYKNDVYLHTDLVFNPQIYYIFNHSQFSEKEKYIGIIFRDWIYYDNKINELISLYYKFLEEGKKVKFISFNPRKDEKGLRLLNDRDIPVLKYNPFEIQTFMEELSKAEWIISQRAHGLIVAHLLGIPSIGIEIEPKIRNVYQMIPRSSQLVSLKNIHLIPELLKNKPTREGFFKDKEENVLKINHLIKDLKKWGEIIIKI